MWMNCRPSTTKLTFFFHPRVVTTSKLTIFFHPRVVTTSKLTFFFSSSRGDPRLSPLEVVSGVLVGLDF
jgi:hypothetical protein